MLIAFAGVIFAYLGYRLYLHGFTVGRGKAEAHSKFGNLILSGTGPGLFFMFFGAVILMFDLLFGGASSTTRIRHESSELPAIRELPKRVASLEEGAPLSKENSKLLIEIINVLKDELPDFDRVTRPKINEIARRFGIPLPPVPPGIPTGPLPTPPEIAPNVPGGDVTRGGVPGSAPGGGVPGGSTPGGGSGGGGSVGGGAGGDVFGGRGRR